MSEENPGQDEQSTIPAQEMGINPYFPEGTSDDEQAGSEADTVATEAAATDAGEQAASTGEDQFMAPGDIPEGMDTSDPNYKHFQAAFTKATQKRADETKALREELDALKAQFQAGGKKPNEQVEEVVGPPPGPPGVVQVDFSGYQPPTLDEESPLNGLEAEITQLMIPIVNHTVNNIAQQQQRYMDAAAREQTIGELEGFVNQVGAQHPGKQAEAIALLKEYAAFAQSDPKKFITFATGALQIGQQAAPPTEKTVMPQTQPSMSERQQAAVPRPTTNGATHPVGASQSYAPFQAPDNTRSVVA
ncbi:MAG TPA: hypothetical protein VNA25_14760, partial [Phycisphaerae bacterium]|nr:hypothetical protein [Phycisphaerae bacterium]